MANALIVRAYASCLPLIGPVVMGYNLWEVNRELRALRPVLTRTEDIGILAIARGLSKEKNQNEFKDKYTSIALKNHVYLSCGIVGEVLSAATVAVLVACKILSEKPGVIVGGVFAFHAVALGALLYLSHRRKNCSLNQN